MIPVKVRPTRRMTDGGLLPLQRAQVDGYTRL
jgi:hypothetical protein